MTYNVSENKTEIEFVLVSKSNIVFKRYERNFLEIAA